MTSDARNPRARILGTGRSLPLAAPEGEAHAGAPPADGAAADASAGDARRRGAAGETTSDLATRAAKAALDAAGLGPRDLEMIILATSSGDAPMPATAVYVQQKLGAELIPSFDLSASLTGFLYGLSVASQFVAAGTMKHVLVIGADLLSRRLDPRDRASAQLFGDGAGAVVVGPAAGDGRGILSVSLRADGKRADVLQVPGGGSAEPLTVERLADRRQYLRVKQPELRQAVEEHLGAQALAALASAGLAPADVDWVIPHHADAQLAAHLADRLGCPRQRVLGALDGESAAGASAGSVAIALDEALRDGRILPGHHVLLCALGGGLTWGSAVVRM
ncbi:MULTISPECIES: beta-ketoacyl-ACP synthase 3 [Sorangium]|uniref:3-oxoacyl-ACP synthase III n=1 Tax=Sorangium cellulosum TaxID=56 RepID=A0A4P2QMA6_SORCE|nr:MULTISPECIES: beta-ketoacyl-ACP synthase 3 [Sorangium]AUX31150.1 3-oxoacyl-ACP synthase III [Sorangium cellulosum]WCQ90530.1 3-oxoacyl-[acyl-carrier-protein] synthase 3 protein 1 [Sorangium sp. Soce836]